MKKIVVVGLVAFMNVSSAQVGWYTTAQFGYAAVPKEKPYCLKPCIKDITAETNGLAGRIGIGYQSGDYLALEAGYLWAEMEMIHVTVGTNPTYGDISIRWKRKIQLKVGDLVLKGIIPVDDSVKIYGKLGMAILEPHWGSLVTKSTKYLTRGLVYDSEEYIESNDEKPAVGGIVGIGISYDLKPNIPIDLSWTAIYHRPNSGKDITYHNFFAVGIGYRFL